MNYSNLPSEELIVLCATAPDEAAWREFVARFTPVVYKVASREVWRWQLDPRPEPEDLVQTILLKICDPKVLQTFEKRENTPAEAFISKVATHAVIDHLKSLKAKKRWPGKATLSLDAEGMPEPRARESDEAAVVNTIFQKQIKGVLLHCLHGSHRERDLLVFRLYYRQGFSAPEIASLLGSELTVKGVEAVIARLVSLIRNKMFPGKDS